MAVGAEQWPVTVLWIRSHLPHAGQRVPYPATLNSIGHQRHARFQRQVFRLLGTIIQLSWPTIVAQPCVPLEDAVILRPFP